MRARNLILLLALTPALALPPGAVARLCLTRGVMASLLEKPCCCCAARPEAASIGAPDVVVSESCCFALKTPDAGPTKTPEGTIEFLLPPPPVARTLGDEALGHGVSIDVIDPSRAPRPPPPTFALRI